jgi:methylenetetrahydrofolate dehydrogenase (NADP+)/methenyltetrahydrofolate cyclohydrolase
MIGLNIKSYVAQEKEILKEKIKKQRDSNLLITPPILNIVQVGNVEASNRYVRNKVKDCEEVGIDAKVHHLPESITTYELASFVDDLWGPTIVQLPLPAGVKAPRIKPWWDVDGFGPEAKHTACTPGGIIDYLDAAGFDYEGKLAVIIGRSEIVGKPMAKLLLDKNCTTAVVHSKTREDIKKMLLLEADLIVCAVGKAGFLDPTDCNPDAFIVDVGINFDENGKLVGDVIPSMPKRTTPVPGGVGLLTRLKLMKNTINCYI